MFLRAKYFAATAPTAAVLKFEHSVPSINAIGNPFFNSDNNITADKFCALYFKGFSGKTDTHFIP